MNAVEMRNITKRFSDTLANRSVNFSVMKGEIHSLLGENGAGKTTLMKILYGMYQPDEGEILINGEKKVIANPSVAIRTGIAMVHQHFMLVDNLTVAENVVLGYEPRKGAFFDLARSIREVEDISRKYGLKVDAKEKIENLPVGAKQRVEILKALYRKADLFILDEPTAVLTPLEVEDLFRVLRELKNDGKTIIMITHKLKETMDAADRATVLRGGSVVGTVRTSDTTTQELAEMMVGRTVSFDSAPPSTYEPKTSLLSIRGGNRSKNRVPVLRDLNLELLSGEIVGLAGVEGNGQTELIEALTGLHPLDSGEILFRTRNVSGLTPFELLELGVGHIPEDRNKMGLVGDFSIKENAVLGYHNRFTYQSGKRIRTKAVREHAETIRTNYQVKAENVEMPVKKLSGGNQQKIVIGRVLSQNPDVIIAAQPTRGVDIGAIEYIHGQLIAMRDQGKAVLLVSAELDEIRKLSDKIAVIYEGKIVAFDRVEAFDEYQLGTLMTGGGSSSGNTEGGQTDGS
jgi:ABC-type uncharacterized transport system ATPase subunit